MATHRKTLQHPDIQTFIKTHIKDDVAKLALKKPPNPDWPYPDILNQIKARQKARAKLPNWAENYDLILPSPDLIEQASSEACATYKASLFEGQKNINTFTDLTAGAGIDTAAFMQHFKHGVCVDSSADNTKLLTHNLPHLTRNTIAIQHQKAEDAIQTLPDQDLIFIDPARRDKSAKGFVNLEDYSPNVIDMLPALKTATDHVLIKASPMIDLWSAVENLIHTRAIHIIEWHNDCKEVLFTLDMHQTRTATDIPIHCVTLNDDGTAKTTFTFTKDEENNTSAQYATPQENDILFEPNPALMKGGAFNLIARRHGLQKIAPHTHLYIGAHTPDLSGRWFTITDITDVNRKSISAKKANLTIRNFPDTVENLRKKLKLKEGGTDYLFACTLKNDKKRLLHCVKI